jgi:hypothetical protein
VLAPCAISYKLGDDEMVPLYASARRADALWFGETKTDERLTTYTPGAEEKIRSDFERAVADRDDTTVWMNVRRCFTALQERRPRAGTATGGLTMACMNSCTSG